MIICPKCKKEISEFSVTCPFCNNKEFEDASIQKKPFRKQYLAIILAVIAIPLSAFVITGALVFSSKPEPTKPEVPHEIIKVDEITETHTSAINSEITETEKKPSEILSDYILNHGDLIKYNKIGNCQYEIYGITYEEENSNVVFAFMEVEIIGNTELNKKFF